MEDSLSCNNCSAEVVNEQKFCAVCGYPQNGTLEEQNLFNYKIKLRKNVVKGANKKIKSVKILLYVIAGLNLLIGLYLITSDITFADGLIAIISCMVYLGCVIWVNNQPLIGILAAFTFYILTQLSVLLVDPSMIFNGLIIKAIVIGVFIKGITSANDARKYNAELKQMNAA